MKQVVRLSLALYLLTACSFDVKDANAPTNPPETAESSFNSKRLVGELSVNGPRFFLWPVERFNEATQKMEPMTLEEQAIARGKITGYAEQLPTLEKEIEVIVSKVRKEWALKGVELLNDWKTNKCYSLCEPDGEFFCFPDDDTVTEITFWKEEPESEEEAALIVKCQENQEVRANLEDSTSEAIAEATKDIVIKAKAVAGAFEAEVGKPNIFGSFEKMIMNFGEFSCENNVERLSCKKAEGTPQVFVRMKYANFDLSNYKGATDFQISNILLDETEGYLDFEMPAVDEESQEVYGTFSFALEFTELETGVQASGEVRLKYLDDRKERVGFFLGSGAVE